MLIIILAVLVALSMPVNLFWYAAGRKHGGELARAQSARPALPRPVGPEAVMCGCDHHKSFHNAEGRCSQEYQQGTSFQGEHMTKFNWKPCPCKQFVPKNGVVAAPALLPVAKPEGYDKDWTEYLEFRAEQARRRELEA